MEQKLSEVQTDSGYKKFAGGAVLCERLKGTQVISMFLDRISTTKAPSVNGIEVCSRYVAVQTLIFYRSCFAMFMLNKLFAVLKAPLRHETY
jgi:hypothetical protein